MPDKTRLARHIVYASKATKVAKASRFGIVASAILTFLIFAISYYGQRVGNFTFTIERMAQGIGLRMFEQDIMPRQYATILRTDRVESADGMTGYCGTSYTFFQPGDGVCIPSDHEAGAVDGNNNGTSYLVYTYYVENGGDRMLDLVGKVEVDSESKGAIESIRVRVIIDGVGITYARRQTMLGSVPGAVEPLTQPFFSTGTVMNRTIPEFKPGQVAKVTVIIWYEGEDPDHNNSIMGGGVKLKMSFTYSRVYEE